MAFEEELARGRVVIEVDEDIRREMTQAEAEFTRGMKRMDDKEAVLHLRADYKQYKADLEKAEQALKAAERRKQNALEAGDKAEAKRASDQIRRAETTRAKVLKEHKALHDGITQLAEQRTKAEERRDKRLQTLERRQTTRHEKAARDRAKADQKAADDAVKAAEKAEKRATEIRVQELGRRTDRTKREAREQRKAEEVEAKKLEDTLSRIRATREEAEARSAKRILTDSRRARDQDAREEAVAARNRERDIQQASSRQSRYIQLAERRAKLERQSRKAFTPESERIKIRYDISAIDESLAEIRARLIAANRDIPDLDIHVNDRGNNLLSKFAHSLSDTAVRIGPFTTSVAGAARSLALLGPTITGVIGALGALTGAVGAAAIGFGGLATAGVTAFGAVFGSIGLLLPSLLRDFKGLNTLQKAYHTQVLKTGANSEKAKTKLKEFRHALGEVTPTTLKAFQSLDELQGKFRNLRGGVRTDFFNSLGQGIRTANKLLDEFGGEIQESFRIGAKAASDFFRVLRGGEFRSILQQLFDVGQKALPAFIKGISNLFVGITRIGAAYGRVFPEFIDGFEGLTQRFLDFTRNGPKMVSLVNRTAGAFHSLFRFLGAASRFLIAFFDQGVEPGIGLLDRMSGGLDKVSASIRSGSSLQDFFGDSVETTEKLFGALKPLFALFIEWSTIMRPLTNIMLDVTAAVAGLVHAIAAFAPSRLIIQGLFAAFIARGVVSRIQGIADATKAAAGAMRLYAARAREAAAAETIGAVSAGRLATGGAVGRSTQVTASRGISVLGTAGAAAGGQALGNIGSSAAQATKAAGAMGSFGKAARFAKVGLTGVGAVLGIANPLFGGAILAAGGAALAIHLMGKRSRELNAELKESASATGRTIDAYNALATTAPDIVSQHRYAALAVKQAREQLKHAKKGTDEYRYAQLQLSDAQRQLFESEQAQEEARRESDRLSKERIDRARKQLSVFDEINSKRIQWLRDEAKENKGTQAGVQYQRALNNLLAARKEKEDGVSRALNAQASAHLNLKRARKGMVGLTGTDQQALGELQRRAPQLAQRVALKFPDPHDVARRARELLAKLPEGRLKVRVDARESDFKTIRKNFDTLKTQAFLSIGNIKRMTDDSFHAIRRSMGVNSEGAKRVASENFRAAMDAILRNTQRGKKGANEAMSAILSSFRSNSRLVKSTTSANFHAAADAIKSAVRAGIVSSERGAREINKLWTAQLGIYGFTPKQAKIAMRGRGANGQLNIPQDEGRQFARGGLATIGNKGAAGRDNVPAMLNGQPSVVARGEQIAVFNRHQQQSMNQMLPGGLEGFFAQNNKPHYMSKGGQIGTAFAGKVKAFALGGMLAAANRLDAAHFPYVWGGGHSATPAPFGPVDCSGAVSYVLQQGGVAIPTMVSGALMNAGQPGPGPVTVYANPEHTLMSIGGRFFGTSGSNPGGGAGWIPTPSSAYLARFAVRHFDGAGGGLDALSTIGIPKIGDDVGGVLRPIVKGALAGIAGAANASISNLAASFLGGGDANNPIGGTGAASRAQMTAWATQALTATGVGATAANIAKLLELAMKESSWIVDSINNWDSNAKAGNPSGGLMHVTLDKVGGSMARLFNPVANMIASIKYQIAQYGHLVTFSPYATGGIAQGTKHSLDTHVSGGPGGMIKKPTLMMGEEPSNEFVISTNPSYRKSNQERLSMAARALGIPQAATGYTPPSTGLADKTNRPGRVPKFPKRTKPTRKRVHRAMKKAGRWHDYITNLFSRRDSLERAAGIAEGHIEEPTDFLVEVGRITTTDPETGQQVDMGPEMAYDVEGVKAYHGQLDEALKFYTALQSVVNELFSAIPQAIAQYRKERSFRKFNISELRKAIVKDNKLLNKKGASKETKRHAKQRITKNENRIQAEQSAITDIDNDIPSLRDDRKDLNFDKADVEDSVGDLNERILALGEATTAPRIAGYNAEAERQNAETLGDTAGGGGGPTGLEQVAMADTERANILREFGSNTGMKPIVGVSGGPGGGGLQTNLSGSGGISGMLSSTYASSAATAGFMSANTAAGAVSSMGATSGGIAGSGAVTTGSTVNIVNNNSFLEPAPDPHTYIQGLQFEANAVI